MSFVHWLVILSAVISILGFLSYTKDTLLGKSKQNRVTYFMWALSPLLGATIAISAHADLWATSRVFLAGFMPVIIFVASFANSKGYWKLTKFDFLCGACSLLAVILWLFAHSPLIAILLAILGDAFAAVPTLVKLWKFPESETGLFYLADFFATILILPSITVWNIQNSAFQIYLLLIDALLFIPIYRKKLFFGKKFTQINKI